MSTVTLPSALSWSQLSTWADCGEKWRLSKLERVPEIPQGALIAGREIHAAIAQAEPESMWQREDARDPDGPIAARFLASTARDWREESAA